MPAELISEYGGSLGAVLAVGGAWGTSLFRINLQGRKIEEIEDDLEKHEKHVIDRLARIETKIDNLSSK